MWDTVSTAFEKLSSLFGRGYLMSGFLPMLVLGATNAAIAWWLLPGMRPLLEHHVLSASGLSGWFWAGVVFALAVAGFVVWSLNPGFRKLLEGRALPEPLRSHLHSVQLQRLAQYEAELARLDLGVRSYREFAAPTGDGSWRQVLKNARIAGNELVVSVDPHDPAANNGLENRYKALCREIRASRENRLRGVYPTTAELNRIKPLLEQALREQPADIVKQLHDMHWEMLACLDAAASEVESKYLQAYTERRTNFPIDQRNVAATVMGNYGEIANDYVVRRYGLDLDIFLVRAQKVLLGTDGFQQLVESTKARLDLSVALTVLSGATFSAWSVAAFVNVPALAPFAILSGTGTAIVWGLYGITRENLRAYVEVLLAAVDLYRFDLAKALRLGLPKNSNDERALWKRFRQQGDPSAEPLEYDHATSPQ